MRLKISISGAFCTGKTTLSTMLTNELPNSILVNDYGRRLKTLFPMVNWKSQIVRDHMLFSKLAKEKEIELDNDYHEKIICYDTGILDSIGHSFLFKVDHRLDLVQELKHHRYDLVILCDPQDISIVDDGLRHTDEELRQKLHLDILRIAKILNYEPMMVSGSPEKRLKTVLGAIYETLL